MALNVPAITITFTGVSSLDRMTLDGIVDMLNLISANNPNIAKNVQNHRNTVDDNYDTDDDSRQGVMTREDVTKLINKAAKERQQSQLNFIPHSDLTALLNSRHEGYVHHKNPTNTKNSYKNLLKDLIFYSYGDVNHNYHKIHNKHFDTNEDYSKQYLPKRLKDKSPNRDTANIYEKRVPLSTLLGSYNAEDANNFGRTHQKKIPDVIVIFNSKSKDSKDRNKNMINNKISSILYSSPGYQKSKITMDQHNNGFLEYDGLFSRRFKPGSGENSIEDYKPKRSRGDRPAGRTAIPYISHRGDIYERD